jgi:hypothetical protein
MNNNQEEQHLHVADAYPSIRDQNYEFLALFVSFVINFTIFYYLYDYLITIFYRYEIVFFFIFVSFTIMFILLNRVCRYLNIFYKCKSKYK